MAKKLITSLIEFNALRLHNIKLTAVFSKKGSSDITDRIDLDSNGNIKETFTILGNTECPRQTKHWLAIVGKHPSEALKLTAWLHEAYKVVIYNYDTNEKLCELEFEEASE
ncbi:MAG: hypothetical protein OXR68_02310 [Alphaproteobacteria bacterium]|nr:hypothetical protein [Alphaproteobacteria bacterium]MDD9919442.1 hypothetical protein [Alphaproteobacteria bacterium]